MVENALALTRQNQTPTLKKMAQIPVEHSIKKNANQKPRKGYALLDGENVFKKAKSKEDYLCGGD